MTEPTPPKMPYWHVYTDAEGVSRQELFHLERFNFEGINPETAPQWNDKMDPAPSVVTFTVLPVGWVGEWHENPAPQWIVVLSGRWWIESMDGFRIEQGPGEFSLGEDQNCTEQDGKRGHRSGTIGDQPAVLMTVQLHVEPQRAPCHAR